MNSEISVLDSLLPERLRGENMPEYELVNWNDPETFPDWWYDDQSFWARVGPYFNERELKRLPITPAGVASKMGLQRHDIKFLMENIENMQKNLIPKNILLILAELSETLEQMMIAKGGSTAGLIFLAKQYGYVESQNINFTHKSMGNTLADLHIGQVIDG